MKKYELKKGDTAYATGVFLVWTGSKWEVHVFEDDTYFDGYLVEEVEYSPYIEYRE